MYTSSLKNKENDSAPIIISSALYVGVALVSNICSLRVVSIFGRSLDAGTFIYPLAFTLRDVSQKILGKRGVKKLIFVTALICLFSSLAFQLIAMIPEDAESTEIAGAWAAVLTPVWRITISSIIAGLAAELADTEVYSWWTEKVTKKHQWARVLVSNLVSVPLDSLIFAFGSFFGSIPLPAVWEIFYGNIIIKFIVTLISIPMIYLVKDPETDNLAMDGKAND